MKQKEKGFSLPQKELFEFERPTLMCQINEGKEKGRISLSKFLGSFKIFRGLDPERTGYNAIFGTASASSFHNLQSKENNGSRPVPRKIDFAYASYLALTIPDMKIALMIGDTDSDLQVAKNLRRTEVGIDSYCVIVNPEIAKSQAELQRKQEDIAQQGFFYDEIEQTWFASSWRVMKLVMSDTPNSFIGRINQQKNEIQADQIVMLLDIDGTVWGPRTIAVPGELDKRDGYSYIQSARQEAFINYAQNYIFQQDGEWKEKFLETYERVKKTKKASDWDDEDTNFFLTGLIFFGFEAIENLDQNSTEGIFQYTKRKVEQISTLDKQTLLLNLRLSPAYQSLHSEENTLLSWTRFNESIDEIDRNLKNGFPTLLESFRLEEYTALQRYFDQGKIIFNGFVIDAAYVSLLQGWRIYGISDKPEAAIGMPQSSILEDKLNTILGDEGPLVHG